MVKPEANFTIARKRRMVVTTIRLFCAILADNTKQRLEKRLRFVRFRVAYSQNNTPQTYELHNI
jgi:hypothetical protein